MNSRYGLWILSICVVSLAGCANWQNRLGNRTPGSAATITPASINTAGPLVGTPESPFGEPPPPTPPPPSDPGATLGPLGGAPPQRLDLSAVSSEPSASIAINDNARPNKLYNLNSDSSKSVAKVSESKKSSAISKLAQKASPAKSLDAGESKRPSAVARLSANAGTSKKENAEPVKPATEVSVKAESAGAPAAEKKPSTDDVIDTTLLAQPVRKGSADNQEKESKGPQSRVIPGVNLLNGKDKPAIYPVSNPVAEEPVNLIKFS